MGNFLSLYKMILVNQSTYFREIFNGVKSEDINLQYHLGVNDVNCKECFEVYDADNSGYLSFMELKTCLMDMNFHKQFARQYNPQYAFDQFVTNIWFSFDANMDDKISYEEFIHIHNTILDR